LRAASGAEMFKFSLLFALTIGLTNAFSTTEDPVVAPEMPPDDVIIFLTSWMDNTTKPEGRRKLSKMPRRQLDGEPQWATEVWKRCEATVSAIDAMDEKDGYVSKGDVSKGVALSGCAVQAYSCWESVTRDLVAAFTAPSFVTATITTLVKHELVEKLGLDPAGFGPADTDNTVVAEIDDCGTVVDGYGFNSCSEQLVPSNVPNALVEDMFKSLDDVEDSPMTPRGIPNQVVTSYCWVIGALGLQIASDFANCGKAVC